MPDIPSHKVLNRAWSRRGAIAVLLAAAAFSTSADLAGQQVGVTPPAIELVTPTGQIPGRVSVLIELREEPTAVVYAASLERAGSRDAQALAAAAAAGRAQMAIVEAEQQRLAATLAGAAPGLTELFRAQRVMNGIAATVDASDVPALRRMPGVKVVHMLEPEYPNNSTSVPFLGTPELWANALGLGMNVTGAGIRVGIIDTGVDYQHADFGGTGVLADYQANDRTIISEGFFPSAKVVGGTDFAGDAYTGSNTPTPDPDPMDCNGHGTHVAGTAAGYGVDAAGATFAGPYNTSVPFGSLRIGPGTAPLASLYALRVFGCGGSTNLTVQAIEWTVDPNGDSDLSDHLDVINMSLGSSYGAPTNTSSIAAQNAARAGVIVVTSAGNSGDTYFITGSPGSAPAAIAVAASADSGIAGSFIQVNTPASIAGNYPAQVANFTDPTAPPPPAPSGQTGDLVQGLDPADGAGPTTTDGCSPLTNAAAVAGNVVVLDRGTCGFNVKLNTANAAGAIGLIVVNNIPGDPNLVSMGGAATSEVNFPSVFISQASGDTLKAQLGLGVNVTFSAATAADTLGSFSSRGPRIGSPTTLKPDLAAPGLNITSAQTGVTCTASGCQTPAASGFLPGSDALILSGTSMAAPHVAGIMALLKQLRPDWSIEELKALAMNGSLHDVTLGANGAPPEFDPSRIGAGRIDPVNSATAGVTAFNAEEPKSVSLTFDTEVVGTASVVKQIRVVNKGTVDATYDLSVVPVLDAPGIAISLPGGSTITVPAGQSVLVDVQLAADATAMDHVRDPAIAALQAAPSPLTALGNLSRHWLTSESGHVVFSQGGTSKLRVPVYAALSPASAMTAPNVITTGGAPTGSTSIPLSGTGVCTGTMVAGPSCTGTFPTDEVSLVTPFELQVVSPRDGAAAPAFSDLQYAGVAFDPVNDLVLFGVSTWGNWSTPTQVSFNIYVDFNEDGVYDRILFNSNPGTMASSLFGSTANGQDSFVSGIFNISASVVSVGGAGLFVNRVGAGVVDTALFNTNVMFLAATPAQLGLPGGDATFRYKVVTCPGSAPLCQQLNGFHYDEAAGPFFYNYQAQGFNFAGNHLIEDLNGATVPVAWNTANLSTNGSAGALLLHHHNKSGERAEVVVLDTTLYTDLGITLSATPSAPAPAQATTLTITVSNNGPATASNVQASWNCRRN